MSDGGTAFPPPAGPAKPPRPASIARQVVSVRSGRGRCGCAGPLGRLEQFDQVASEVGEQDLAPAGAGDHVTAEGQAGAAEPGDLGVKVVEDDLDAVAASDG